MKFMRCFFGENFYDLPLSYKEREMVIKCYAEGKRCIILDKNGTMVNTTNADAISVLTKEEN